jgi:hypothetical protein
MQDPTSNYPQIEKLFRPKVSPPLLPSLFVMEKGTAVKAETFFFFSFQSFFLLLVN